jgi:hypothetical protein
MEGRLEMVEAQRNDAMNKCAIQAGHIKVLLGTVDELQKEIDGLGGENMVDNNVFIIEDAPGEDGED